MARYTIGAKPEIRFVLFFLYFIIPDESLFMAITAILFTMGPLELVSRKVMIKILLFKTDDIKCPPMMVIVTTDTRFACDGRRGMITLSCINPGFNLTMAGQALFI